MSERLTDEQLREWAYGNDDLAFNEQQCRTTAAELLALRLRVAQLEAELKGANLAADKLGKAYDAACAMLRNANP